MRTQTMTETCSLLIVDDSHEVRYLLGCALEADERFTVVGEADTARAGLELALRARPDAVMVDLFLIGEDGLWLLRRLRRDLPGARLVAVTGSSDPVLHAEATAAGADAVLEKRNLTTSLLDKLDAATRR
ncbi:response regulator transcription factor [Actinospongicola halichondriae]|uniref:response regulator transcription factor n=1 Tax=Actinospongicola halichondriae TaxID=3236844 RepID=UPI003D5741BF